MRSPVIVVGRFAFKFPRDSRGRASNLYEANLYRSVNATRCALLCPVLWVSQHGAVQIMRAAKPLTDMMSLDEYMRAAEAWDYMPGEDSCPLGMVRKPHCRARLLDPDVGGRRTYFRLRSFNELAGAAFRRDVHVLNVRDKPRLYAVSSSGLLM